VCFAGDQSLRPLRRASSRQMRNLKS
jgi:hypothetical protein